MRLLLVNCDIPDLFSGKNKDIRLKEIGKVKYAEVTKSFSAKNVICAGNLRSLVITRALKLPRPLVVHPTKSHKDEIYDFSQILNQLKDATIIIGNLAMLLSLLKIVYEERYNLKLVLLPQDKYLGIELADDLYDQPQAFLKMFNLH